MQASPVEIGLGPQWFPGIVKGSPVTAIGDEAASGYEAFTLTVPESSYAKRHAQDNGLTCRLK